MIANNATRLVAVVLTALLVNAIMFTAIRYMVINQEIRLADTTEFDLADFIRTQEQSREVRSRRDPKAPELIAELLRVVDRHAEADRPPVAREFLDALRDEPVPLLNIDALRERVEGKVTAPP